MSRILLLILFGVDLYRAGLHSEVTTESTKLQVRRIFLWSRALIQKGILSIFQLFLREHNYQCDRLKELNPSMDAQELFDEARRIVRKQNIYSTQH